MDVAVGTEIGIWQRRNGESYLSERLGPNLALLGVADGFGAVGRDVAAASLALGWLRDYVRRRQRAVSVARGGTANDLRALALGAMEYANARLYEQSGSHEDFVSGGASLTVVLIAGHRAVVAHAGDARAYLMRLGRLEALTPDDAVFADVLTGAKTSGPVRPSRSLLWRSLGTQPKAEASVAHLELLAGDQLLLCTAGVYRCVDHEEIADALSLGESAGDTVARWMNARKTRGGLENGTAVVGRDLLAHAHSAAEAPRGDGRARSLVALVMLCCAAVLLAYFVYREGELPPVTEILSGDHR
jgi:protein phosphatase